MRFKQLMAATLLAGVVAAPASAVTNFTTDFDDFVIGGPGWGIFSAVDGWTGGANGIEVQSNGIAGAPYTGTNLVELDTSANSSMSHAIDAGQYSLSFAYSARPGYSAATTGIGVYLGSTLLGQISMGGGSSTNWALLSYNFTAAAADTLTFAALGASDGVGGYLDNIQLVGTSLPVPEPAEWAMLLAGLGVVGFIGSRRRAA